MERITEASRRASTGWPARVGSGQGRARHILAALALPLMAIALALATALVPTTARADLAAQTMYRLYNPWSGEHLFTVDYDEYESLGKIGWNQEGVAWLSPWQSDTPVYRLYNQWSGDHFYTKDYQEYQDLGSIGWNQEDVAFYSADPDASVPTAPIYRLFNPYVTVGTHLFTTDEAEYQSLGVAGWSQEGVAFYCLVTPEPEPDPTESTRTLVYDCNGGYVSGGGTTLDVHYSAGENDRGIAVVPSSRGDYSGDAFVRDGYALVSWNTEPDGSGTAYHFGDDVTTVVPANGTLTLYAQWAPMKPLSSTWATLYDDGELVISDSESLSEDRNIVGQEQGSVFWATDGEDSELRKEARNSATKITCECYVKVTEADKGSANTDLGVNFSGWSKLSDISGLAYWDVSGLTNLDSLFNGCESLGDLSPLVWWDTSNVTSMEGMFQDCTSLTALSGLEGWNVSKVAMLNNLFCACDSLQDISALANWDVSSAKSLYSTFMRCSSLTKLYPLDTWNVSNVESLDSTFYGCTSLTDLTPLESWDVSQVEYMGSAFEGCTSLADVSPLASWDVSSATNTTYMFHGCSALRDASALSPWNVSYERTNIYETFDKNLDAYPSWYTDVYLVIYLKNNYESVEQCAPVGQDAIAKANTFQNPGQEFTGWNTNQNGHGTSYAVGDTIPNQGDQNIVLFAQWKQASA